MRPTRRIRAPLRSPERLPRLSRALLARIFVDDVRRLVTSLSLANAFLNLLPNFKQVTDKNAHSGGEAAASAQPFAAAGPSLC